MQPAVIATPTLTVIRGPYLSVSRPEIGPTSSKSTVPASTAPAIVSRVHPSSSSIFVKKTLSIAGLSAVPAKLTIPATTAMTHP